MKKLDGKLMLNERQKTHRKANGEVGKNSYL